MDEKADTWIREEVEGLAARRIGGHDNGWMRGERCRRKVGVVHERDVWG